MNKKVWAMVFVIWVIIFWLMDKILNWVNTGCV